MKKELNSYQVIGSLMSSPPGTLYLTRQALWLSYLQRKFLLRILPLTPHFTHRLLGQAGGDEISADQDLAKAWRAGTAALLGEWGHTGPPRLAQPSSIQPVTSW